MQSSDNKVSVTKLFGGGGSLGVMDPKINMQVKMGCHGETFYIAQIFESGTFQLGLAFSGGGGVGSQVKRIYPHQAFVEYSHATGTWSFPTGDGSLLHTHNSGNFEGGFDVAIGTGVTVGNPNGNPTSFGR